MQKLAPSTFIVFEGGEGAGKSTQIRLLNEKIQQSGYQTVMTFEPGGTVLGQKVRELLLDPSLEKMSSRCEALLYAASRSEHVEKVIGPALASGKIVISDRYWDASRAYQGVARGLGIAWIDRINQWATGDLFPNRVYYFDLDAEHGLKRAEQRSGQKDRLEQEAKSFHDQVREAYRSIALANPESYLIIDASRGIEEISDLIWKDFSKHFL